MKNYYSICLNFLLILYTLIACGNPKDFETARSQLNADGATWGLHNMSDDTYYAIKAACEDGMGAYDLGLSVDECYLIMAGSTVAESSWQANKACEAWGNSGDPCCGLTQSRRQDTYAVGLQCDPQGHHHAAYKCNVLTGLRNIGCKASGGHDCRRHSNDGSIFTGVKKHLGYNSGALHAYMGSMSAVYHRQDVRSKFGVNTAQLRDWNTLIYQGRQQTYPQQDGGWTDPYSQQRYPYCKSSYDPDGDGWGHEGSSCKIR